MQRWNYQTLFSFFKGFPFKGCFYSAERCSIDFSPTSNVLPILSTEVNPPNDPEPIKLGGASLAIKVHSHEAFSN